MRVHALALVVVLGPALADARAQTPAESGGLDIVALDYTATLDPETGVASGALDITVRVASDEPSYELGLLMDAGLEVRTATAQDLTVSVATTATTPLSRVVLGLAPAPAVGAEVVLRVTFDGALACSVTDARGHRACSFGAAVGHLRLESILPRVWDEEEGLAAFELYRRSLTLVLPVGLDAVGAGDVVSAETADGMTTHVWASDVVHVGQDLVVVYGALASLEVPRAPEDMPITLWHARGAPAWTSEFRDWSEAAMPLLEALAGSPLPFDRLDLVLLPPIDGFDGTATANLVLLSQTYGDALGAGAFEQTLAHELSHRWWGNVA